jgi:hypothetical protein
MILKIYKIKENKITNNKMENFDLRKYLAEGRLYENTDEEIKVILTKSYPGAYSEGDFKEIINLYNTKYRDYKDSYGKLDGVEQAAFKFNYANNRDIETGMKAGSKSSTSIDFPEMEDEFEGAMSSMSISKEEYLQDIIDASADEIVSDSYFEIKNAVEQEIYSKNEAVKLAKEWARKKLSTLAEGKLFEEKMSLEVDDDYIELSDDSGEYDGDLNDDGTVDFSVFYDDGTEFDESNWKSILGKKHAFVKISNQIPTKVEAAGDYVMITVDLEDLKNLIKPNKSKNMKNLGSYETKDSKGNIVKRYI